MFYVLPDIFIKPRCIKKVSFRFFYILSINKFHGNFASCISGIVKVANSQQILGNYIIMDPLSAKQI